MDKEFAYSLNVKTFKTSEIITAIFVGLMLGIIMVAGSSQLTKTRPVFLLIMVLALIFLFRCRQLISGFCQEAIMAARLVYKYHCLT
jgi:Mg/Co/Ni transporter MgtE